MGVWASVNDPLDNSRAVSGAERNNGLATNSSTELQNSFLTLLVAQLKNQDPTNPLQNNELTTQLAQINTVSGIEKLNTTLGAVAGQINSNQELQAAGLIGRGVMVPGSTVLSGKGETTPFGIELERPAGKVMVNIVDANGQAVRQIELTGLTAGVHSFTWNGEYEDGTVAPDGAYTFTLSALSGDGEQMVVQPLHYALVNGVIRDGSGGKLDLGVYGSAPLSDVRQIL